MDSIYTNSTEFDFRQSTIDSTESILATHSLTLLLVTLLTVSLSVTYLQCHLMSHYLQSRIQLQCHTTYSVAFNYNVTLLTVSRTLTASHCHAFPWQFLAYTPFQHIKLFYLEKRSLTRCTSIFPVFSDKLMKYFFCQL